MTLEEKATMARKTNVIQHLADIQAKLVQFKVSGFHLEEDLRLDPVMKVLKELDSEIDRFMENHGAVKEPGADVETSAPGLN